MYPNVLGIKDDKTVVLGTTGLLALKVVLFFIKVQINMFKSLKGAGGVVESEKKKRLYTNLNGRTC